MSRNERNKRDKSDVKLVSSSDVRASGSAKSYVSVTSWQSYEFAHEWFSDALSEAQKRGDYNERRREILFAVCFAEVYLFEWVRDVVLARNFSALNKYFKPGEWNDVRKKWKDIPKQLAHENLIDYVPDLKKPHVKKAWDEFCKLVDYRNGLVHGRASRPERKESRPATSPQPDKEKPLPSKDDLDHLPPGWAVRVVVTLVQHLHDAAGKASPAEWLVCP